MARYLFGAGVADYVVRPTDGLWGVAPSAVITCWDAADGGTQYTDLLDADGTPVTEIVADSTGLIPQFSGPDSVTGMWVRADDSTRVWIEARGTSAGGGGGGYTSIQRIVASATAPADVRAAAMYVCDGVADHVQIQQALDDARDSGGGVVQLTVGEYNLTSQLSIEGTDNVDVEIGISLLGQGARATMLNAASGMTSAIHLTAVVRVHLEDLGITIGGATHGITSETTNGASSGHRSFWNSTFRNLQINGPWDGSHTGWALNLGSPFRSVFENIEIGGVGNGLRFYSEHADFNPGDSTVERVFVDLVGDNGTAYQVESTTAAGVMNQLEFEMCEAIASGAGCTGIHITGTGGWGTSHTHWRGVNLEKFDKLVHVEYGSGNTFRLNHVGLRDGASGLTAFTFGASSFNNAVLSTGLLYVTDACELFDDGSTMETGAPNRILDTRVYTAGAVAVTGTVNPARTTVCKGITHSGSGTMSVGSAGPTRFVVKPADTSVSSNVTPAADPDLVLPVEAGATYDVEVVAVWTTGGGGFRAGWTVPTGATMVWVDNDGVGLSSATGVVTFSATTGTTLRGTLVVGATAGTVALRWAQNTSNAAATILRAGCSMKVERVA